MGCAVSGGVGKLLEHADETTASSKVQESRSTCADRMRVFISSIRAKGWCAICTVPRVLKPRRATLSSACGLLGLSLAIGCVNFPGRRYAMDTLSVSGNDKVSDDEILDHIA